MYTVQEISTLDPIILKDMMIIDIFQHFSTHLIYGSLTISLILCKHTQKMAMKTIQNTKIKSLRLKLVLQNKTDSMKDKLLPLQIPSEIWQLGHIF